MLPLPKCAERITNKNTWSSFVRTVMKPTHPKAAFILRKLVVCNLRLSLKGCRKYHVIPNGCICRVKRVSPYGGETCEKQGRSFTHALKGMIAEVGSAAARRMSRNQADTAVGLTTKPVSCRRISRRCSSIYLKPLRDLMISLNAHQD